MPNEGKSTICGPRVLICGGRDFADWDLMLDTVYKLGLTKLRPRPVLVHGDARGADRMAEHLWQELQIGPTEAHPADWEKNGKAAGPIRNKEMLDSGVEMVIAFAGGKGTADMVNRAREAGVEVCEVSA